MENNTIAPPPVPTPEPVLKEPVIVETQEEQPEPSADEIPIEIQDKMIKDINSGTPFVEAAKKDYSEEEVLEPEPELVFKKALNPNEKLHYEGIIKIQKKAIADLRKQVQEGLAREEALQAQLEAKA